MLIYLLLYYVVGVIGIVVVGLLVGFGGWLLLIGVVMLVIMGVIKFFVIVGFDLMI